MTETTMTEHQIRAVKSKQTREDKKAAHDAGDFPRRCWVMIDPKIKVYGGKVGKVSTHNDLRTPAFPTITVEIGVVFSKGTQSMPIWFHAEELTRCKPPAQAW